MQSPRRCEAVQVIMAGADAGAHVVDANAPSAAVPKRSYTGFAQLPVSHGDA